MSEERKNLLRTIITATAIGATGFFVLAFMMQPFFSGQFQLPQSVNLGGFRIQFYGLLLALAVLSGYWLAQRRREKYNIDSDSADLIIFIGVLAGFVGARIYHVVSELGFYLSNPGQIFMIWNGGLSIYGAALGAILGIYLFLRFYKQVIKPDKRIWNILDWLVPSLALGQIIGRFGNFINYELYGLPTNLPWKMYVPIQFRIPPYELNQFFHPLFLYEAIGSLVILVLILKLNLRTGKLFLLWLLLYNGMRFFLEYLRVGSVIYGDIRVNAIVSALLVIVAISLWLKINSQDNVE